MNSSSHGSSRTALITGASSGIGLDLARLLAQDGQNLVLVARNQAALDQLADECHSRFGVTAHVLARDLGDPAAPSQIYDELQARSIPIDILVNNAGFGVYGRFDQADLAATLQMLQVNITALTHLTRLFLPAMVQRRWGRILNVASLAAFVPGPLLNVYYASKAYVLSHSIALARELRRTGVSVTALCPGPTQTAFQERAGINHARAFANPMSSLAVARAGYEGMKRGKAIVTPGLGNKLAAFATRFAPRSLLARVTMHLNRGR